MAILVLAPRVSFAACPAYATANASTQPGPTNDWVRVNQVGYLTTDPKIAIAFSNSSLSSLTFSIVRTSDSVTVWGPTAFPASNGAYSPFSNTYKLDFSAFQPSGTNTYKIHLSDGYDSLTFKISGCVYQGVEETILNFYLGQRCGTDNKYAGAACHLAPGGGTTRMDGKVADGPHVNTLLDTSGAWHDSGDFIKFMITVGWSCECMLAAYRDNPSAFQDNLLANGTAGSNGIPDVLDEAKYALDWIIKMNPDATTLYYQVGNDLDHNLGLGTLPQNDNTSYTTSPYRPVYEGTHEGGSNNAGKAAACLAMAYQIWNARGDTAYANTCLTHATQIYAIGKAQAYNQPANPASFYTENGFNDDMEWAAAEMYRATGTASYLTDAKNYATAAGSGGGALDWATSNFLAHYSLYPLVDATTQNTLKNYMQSDVQSFQTQSTGNVYALNTAYNWGSMETMTGGILEAQLYDKLFGVTTYANMATYNRDYLLGKNPWGVCFIVGLGTITAHHPQHNITIGKCIDIPGMPIEGPDTATDYGGQGIALSGPDAYAAFQGTGSAGVYHDDIQDYATNEPTSTHAGLCVFVFANLAAGASCSAAPTATNTATSTAMNTATTTATKTPTATATKAVTPTVTNTPINTSTNTSTSTATNSPTMTTTSTVTNTNTSTVTNTSTNTAGNTATQTATTTSTSTATTTATRTATSTPTDTATSTPTNTVGNTSTNTVTATATYTATATVTRTATNTTTATYTGTSTNTTGNTATSTSTATVTNSATSTATASVTRTATNTVTNTSTNTTVNTATQTATATPTNTPTVTSTYTPTGTSTNTRTNTATSTMTNSPTATVAWTATNTATTTVTSTSTNTAGNTATNTSTATAANTATATVTRTATSTATKTGTSTVTNTATNTGVDTATSTPTTTSTDTSQSTPTSTATKTSVNTSTTTATATMTSSPTRTATFTATNTASPTATSTYTNTVGNTATSTSSATATNTATRTATASMTPTASFTASRTATNTVTTTSTNTPVNTATASATATFTPSPTLTATSTMTSTVTGTPTNTPKHHGKPVVYPNPATGTVPVYLQSPASSSSMTVDLFTVGFRKVRDDAYFNVVEGQDIPIDLHDKSGVSLANGLYYVVIRADGQQWMTKLLVLR